jgi:hypothetical protein
VRSIPVPKLGILFLAFVSFLLTSPTARCAGIFSALSGGGNADSGNFAAPPFSISGSVRGGYDDNIGTTSINRQESWYTNASVLLAYTFGDPRTRFDLTAGAGVTYYFDRISGGDNYDPNVFVGFSLTHKATPRLTLAATAYASYQEEPDFSLVLSLNRRSGSYFYTRDKGTVTYLWATRFSTATSYTLGVVHYDDSTVGAFEDRFENTFGNEFRFLIWPTTNVVAEYRYQIVSYTDIDRDSMSHFALAGFDHKFNPRLDMSVRGGMEFREYSNFGNENAPYFEGALNYALGKDTLASWTNRYAIEESDVSANQSRKTFRTGLKLNHRFATRIIGTVGAYYEHDAYNAINTPMAVAPGFNEDDFDVSVSVRYTMTRYFGIEAGFTHTEVLSEIPVREYSRNRFFAGLNLAF